MKKEILTISKGQYLKDILPEIRTNTIIEKTLCGIGATTLELQAQRDSIIIEPNIPVITGKMNRYPNICGVYEGVSDDDIAEYIQGQKGYKKIMTTPEGFCKVKRAFRKLQINPRQDHFLLFDECEKIVQDIDYRKTISLPIKDFFSFQNKAMVSATPIIPTDPNFEQQNFTHIKVKPDFNYKSKLNLWQTNNPILLLCCVMQKLKKENTICVFFNTIAGIDSIIQKLDIKEQSNIYCSKDSVKELKDKGYNRVYSEIAYNSTGNATMNRYNFFTSRYYSAVDIIMEKKPIVIILSEVFIYPYTLVDPNTEAIQIFGRFRNGISKRIHITNYNYKMEFKTHSQLKEYLSGQHNIYTQLLEMRCSTGKAGEVDILDQALKAVGYSRYVDSMGNVNHFMYDNAFADEQTKSYYKKKADIKTAYEKTNAFKVEYKYIPLSISNQDCQKLTDERLSKTEVNKISFKVLKKLLKGNNEYDRLLLKCMQKNFPIICQALEILGEKGLRKTKFSSKNIAKAISEKLARNKELQDGVVHAIYNALNENQWYSTTELNDAIKDVYNSFNLPLDGRGCANKIRLYFIAEQENRRDKRGWKLGAKIVT